MENFEPTAAGDREKDTVATGYDELDEALDGGFLRGSAVILLSSPSNELPALLRKFVETPPQAGEVHSGLVITKNLSSARAITAQSPRTRVLVCGETAPKTETITGGRIIENLTELNIQFSEVLRAVQPERVTIDILSDVLLHHKTVLTRKWLSEVLSKLRSRRVTTVAVINPAMHPREEIEAVADLFDGGLEIVPAQSGVEAGSILRVRWMHGVNVVRKEVSLASLTSTATVSQISRPRNSVAAIDFANLTAEADVDWLSGAIAETVSVDLKKISGLIVSSREKVSQLLKQFPAQKILDDQAIQIGRALGVAWVIWGAYQKFGGHIRITAHMADTTTSALTGSAKVDGTMDEIFQLQDRIIISLMNTANLAITSSEMQKIETPQTGELAAYEHYAKGRQLFIQFGWSSFGKAQEHFERAIQIDPRYALAFSGLGSIHIFRFIQQTDPRDLEIGVANLQKAIRYDSDLADPYQWLTYAYTRKQQFDEAIAAGNRAIEVEPDNFLAHYFLGAAFTIKSATKHDPNGYILAIDQLQKSVTLQPNYGPAHMILGWILAIYGKYDEAEASFRRAAAIEESGKFEGVKFVGALALLGDLELRRNQLDKALDLYERSLTSLEKVEHLYKNQFAALTHCGIGEAHYLRGLFDQALEHYKTAAELARNNPKSLGIGHILAKALFGLAVVFHKLGMKRESEQHLRDGFELVESRSLYDFSWMWDGSDAQLFYDVTRCLAVMNRRQEAIDYLQRAIDCGWGDTLLLGADELLANIRPEARFQSLLEHLKSVVPPIHERLPPSS